MVLRFSVWGLRPTCGVERWGDGLRAEGSGVLRF